jgi:hypothetical protein
VHFIPEDLKHHSHSGGVLASPRPLIVVPIVSIGLLRLCSDGNGESDDGHDDGDGGEQLVVLKLVFEIAPCRIEVENHLLGQSNPSGLKNYPPPLTRGSGP